MRIRPGIAAAVLSALALASAPCPGADGPAAPRVPEIREIRVPESKVATYFPPGTPLRLMPVGEFEDLVRLAKEGAQRLAGRSAPRLIRASHSARLEDGTLVGRSELVIDGSPSSPTDVDLAPWTPAIEPAEGNVEVRSLADGKTVLRVEPGGQRTVSLSWQLRAQRGSLGRVFELGLPALELSSLTLDLPEGMVPEGSRGLRQGPTQGEEPGRQAWRFDLPGGPLTLHVRSSGPEDARGGDAVAWARGVTRVELLDTSGRWEADWQFDLAPVPPRELRIRLDPGLGLIGVSGPDVAGFRSGPAEGGGAEVAVRLAASARGSTAVRIEALARAPEAGAWKVPAARPLDATWTGGKTLVAIGPSRVVETTRDLAGWRVPPAADERERTPSRGQLLVYDSAAPGPVAEVAFRKPWTDATAEVRGILRVGRDRPEFEAQVSWRVARGPVQVLPIDLPAGWAPDRVQLAGLDEPTTWRLRRQPDGSIRVVVHPPPYLDVSGAVRVTLAGRFSGPLASGVAAPRIRPGEARVSDDVWGVRAEPGLAVRPSRATGLAWLDPAVLSQDSGGSAAGAPSAPVLAWRWTEQDGELSLEVDAEASRISGECWSVGSVEGRRIRLDWYVALELQEPGARRVAVRLGDRLDEPPTWHVLGDELESGLPSRRLDERERLARGFPEGGTIWSVEIPGRRPAGTRVVLHATAERPWEGKGPIPLVSLAPPEHARGVACVRVVPGLHPRATTAGLSATDRSAVRRAYLDLASGRPEAPASTAADLRLALAFEFGPEAGTLDLETRPLREAASPGVIAEARLSTLAGSAGDDLRRLVLTVAPGSSRALEIALPADAKVVRATLDQRRLAFERAGPALRVDLPAPSPNGATAEILVDYTVPPGQGRGGPAGVEWPAFSLPCLASSWDLLVPAGRHVADIRPALPTSDPGVRLSEAPARRATGRRAATLDDLDKKIREAVPVDPTLGEWLSRLDSGRWPLIVDRAALLTAGLGPGSLLARRPASEPRPASARAGFAAQGLAAVPIGGAILVTSADEAPDRPGGPLGRRGEGSAWEAAIREAVRRGHDEADRLQTVARWLGEATPGTRGLLGRRMLDGDWSIARWALPGRPDAPVVARVEDGRSRSGLSWAVGLFVLGAGVAAGAFAPRARALGSALLACAGAVGAAWSGTSGPVVAGLVGGAVGAAAFWLGAEIRARRARRAGEARPSARPAPSHRGSSLVAGAVLLACFAATPQTPLGAQQPPVAEPIIALLPYAEDDGPAARAARVYVRLADLERLEALAGVDGREPEPGLAATKARHEVRRPADGAAEVVSEVEIVAGSEGPADWVVPISGGRDFAAELDGVQAPIRVLPDGRAAVPVGGKGRHTLRIRRVVAVGPSRELRLLVTPVAAARVAVEAEGDGDRVEVATARGRMEGRGGGVVGMLGPAEALDVRWDVGRAEPGSRGTAEGLLLWDIQPAGDRLLARLTYRGRPETPRIRLRLEPGLRVRSASFPGWSDGTWEGTPDRPIWTAPVSPPLRDGETVSLELWRPLAPADGAAASAEGRGLPQVEPLGVEAFSGLVSIRGPVDWTTAISPVPPPDPALEELFRRSWGPLPEGPARPVGLVRWPDSVGSKVRTAPTRPRPTIRPSMSGAPILRLQIGPGRVEYLLEAACSEPSGRLAEISVSVPPALRIVGVACEGLTDWSRPEDGRLRLRFEAMPASERTIRVQGWLPVPHDPLSVDPSPRRMPLPWPTWPGAEVEPGDLEIASARGDFTLDEMQGIAPDVPADAPGLGPRRYRVTGNPPSASMRWPADPSRAKVSIWSHLTLYPRQAEWTALVRYQVVGGPGRTIRLDVPSEWAKGLRLEAAGATVAARAQPNGARTVLVAELDPPAWGTRDLLLRASRPVEGTSLVFPDLVPLGYGQVVNRLLAWVDRSGRGMIAEGSSGIQQVDASKFPVAGLPLAPDPGRRAYQILSQPVSGGWSLTLRAPGGVSPPRADDQSRAVTLADAEIAVDAGGSGLGLARYHLAPGQEPHLRLAMPPGVEPISTAVDGALVTSWVDADRRLLVPVEGGPAGVVQLLWRQAGGGRLAVPSPPDAALPILLSVYGPGGAVDGEGDAIRPVAAPAIEVGRLEDRAERLLRDVSSLDRGSARERSSLLTGLVEFQLQLRATSRMVGDEAESADLGRDVSARLGAAEGRIRDALVSAGLDEFLAHARARVGLSPSDPSKEAPELGFSSPELRIRRLGRPSYFRGVLSPGDSGGPVSWRRAPAAVPTSGRETAGRVLLSIGALALLLLCARRDAAGFLLPVASLALLGLAAWFAGPDPLLLAMGLSMAVLGLIVGAAGGLAPTRARGDALL